jgi:protein-S-isoprenylcysteine O-methyltransferase Ste14
MHHMLFGFLFIGLFHRLIGKLFMLIMVIAVVVLFLKWQQERARNRDSGWN